MAHQGRTCKKVKKSSDPKVKTKSRLKTSPGKKIRPNWNARPKTQGGLPGGIRRGGGGEKNKYSWNIS